MGHRKQRKRARKQTRRWEDEPLFLPSAYAAWDEPAAPSRVWDWRDSLGEPSKAPAATCGSCQEFVEDHESGRGTCLHPGSGVLAPWSDTEACAFFSALRSVRVRG